MRGAKRVVPGCFRGGSGGLMLGGGEAGRMHKAGRPALGLQGLARRTAPPCSKRLPRSL